ncbi:phosphoribosylanthranilate isomerase [uncultured Bacteroides sp.]|uniref:phosphoribosylanthranilate isomerase n=1 Tax=uncultured Bacteroides sp. TaxID=162156 RepID=UPI002613224D|nr:phosphoribosylanthranilate isomerase [uncultured Bacteroides sp.]
MIIKVCGMKYADNIRALDKLKPDMTGFIFHPSSPRFAYAVPEHMPSSSLCVGVFVNSETDYILYKVREFGLNLVQLHGNESPEQCRDIRNKGIKIIKSFSLKTDNADTITAPYDGLCRYYLFDTPCAAYGGSGKTFDWTITQSYHGKTPFLLSGGIKPECLEQISSFRHTSFAGIDINSGFETAPGLKDTKAIAEFIKRLRTL